MDQRHQRTYRLSRIRRDTDHTLALAAGQIAGAELLIQRAAATVDNTHGPPGPLSRDLVVRCRLDYATAANRG